MSKIKYNVGATGLGGSMADCPDSALSTGFTDTTPAQLDPWDPDYVRVDDGGTNSVGNQYEFSKTGACGRPNGNER